MELSHVVRNPILKGRYSTSKQRANLKKNLSWINSIIHLHFKREMLCCVPRGWFYAIGFQEKGIQSKYHYYSSSVEEELLSSSSTSSIQNVYTAHSEPCTAAAEEFDV